jgi:heptosyltransferase-2
VWWARIPQRIGYARPWRNWFLTQKIAPRSGRGPMRKRSSREIRRLIQPNSGTSPRAPMWDGAASTAHHVHDYLFLAAALGANPEPIAPKLELEATEIDSARALLLSQMHPTPTAPTPVFLGMNPSAAYGPAKRWPAENFAAAAREVSARLKDVVWLIFGSAADAQLCANIGQSANVPLINLAGKTTLRELMGLLAACQVLITNDSGPMHLAAALGTPVVVPFGSTSPELTGPGLPGDSRHRLLTSGAACSPCFRRTCPIDLRCLIDITVEQVVSALLERLAAVERQHVT